MFGFIVQLSLYRDYLRVVLLSCAPNPVWSGGEELAMPDLNGISKTLGAMPFEGLIALVILGAFGLAAYAIYAVLTVVKGRR
jgi:hypothetical protein